MYLVSRTATFAKLFFIVSFTGLFMYIALAFYSFHTAFSAVSQVVKYQDSIRHRRFKNLEPSLVRREQDLKYILLWESIGDENNDRSEGQYPFIDNDCSDVNCFITTKPNLLNGNYTHFDAILFNISVLAGWNKANLPRARLQNQRYIFYGMVPSNDHPLCNIHLDNYFNWTWSYKLYSNIFTPFIEVKDLEGKVVAPHPDVIWIQENKQEDVFVGAQNVLKITKGYANFSNIDEVNTKTKALAWVMNKCHTKMNRMPFARKLQNAMNQQALTFDIYGCGNMQCPEDNCKKAIERHYYFYLAYEESMSEDYVTEEVLMGYHNDAVPIVIGGADYTKFLPDKSYINAQKYTPGQLAAFIFYVIKNPTIYREYFNWKKHYTIHTVDHFRGFCDMCTLLNEKNDIEYHSYETFRKWWYYGPLREKCYPKGAERFDELISYLNESKLKRMDRKYYEASPLA